MPGLSNAEHSFPADTKLIEFERTDGSSANWPKNTTKIVSNGEVNFMLPLPLDNNGSKRWREKVGQGIAIKLGYPAGRYALKSWPEGYAFYSHHKGKERSPRTDPYLYGWHKARFRSAQEFIPHAAWLLTDPTMDNSNCECKYCSGKTQKQVAESMPPGVFTTSTSPGPIGLNKRPKDKEKTKEVLRDQLHKRKKPVRESKMFATVQPKPVPLTATKSPNLHPKEAMLPERELDLRAVNARNTILKLKRWYRMGELVWVALPKPIKGFDQHAIIRFWPGIVEDNNLSIKATPNTSSEDQKMDGVQGSSNDDDDKAPWEITQFYNYKIQLLAVNRTVLSPDRLLLPYQAYVPNPELMEELTQYPADQLDFTSELSMEFDPFPPEGKEPGNFDQAVGPIGLAMQIGARLSDFWSLTDEWTFEYTESPGKVDVARPMLPPTVPPYRPGNDNGANSLVNALQTASNNNAMSLSQASSSSFPHSQTPNSSQLPQPISTFSPAPTPAEMRNFQAHVNGVQPAPGQSRTRIQFQGLWWGAERIWTDDFVRLKIPRRRLAPQGTDLIKPPSGPGEGTKAFLVSNGADLPEAEPRVGAGDRGVFMRLDGLYVVDVQTDKGLTKEVRAVGMIYELADEDWTEPVGGPSSISAPPRFVPRPSPLNPHIPASTSTAATSTPAGERRLPYLLPEAPSGFVFRPVLPENYEMIISLCMISGRYYPKILQHPMLETDVYRALSDDSPVDGSEESSAYSHLFALEGLNAGVNNSVDPLIYKGSRRKMMEEALHRALIDLENMQKQKLEAQDDGMDDGEEVDQLQDDSQENGNAMDVDLY